MSNTGNGEIRILKVLFQHKIKLLVITLIVGIVAGIYIKISPNMYSSTAAISVKQPEVSLTGEVSPLNVETLRSLIESTRVKWELFQELKERSVLGDDMTFLRFQQRLSTSVEQDKTRDKNLLPMVKLTATTSDPELSMVIANQWAEVVLRQTKKIYRSGVDELGNFTTNIYEKVSKSLLESEDKYTEILLGSNLTANKMLLDHNKNLYSRLTKEVITLEEDVETRTALLQKTEENLAAQEIDGTWIGEIFAKKIAEDSEYVLPVSTSLTGRIARTIRDLKKNEQAEAEFDESSRLDYKYLMLEIKKGQIKGISGEIMKARTRLSGLEPTYNKLKEELTKINPKIILHKAIGDDKLWEAYLAGDLKNGRESALMQSESSNPVYEETEKELVSLSSQANGLKSTISKGGEELEALRKEVSDLSREVAPLSAQRIMLRSAIQKDRDLLDYYEKSYTTDRQGYEVSSKELAEMEIKLKAKKTKLAEIGEEVAGLEKSVFAGENKIARQKRDVDNLTKVRASFAAKAEEVALLKVAMENVSRSGTVLLYQAQADPDKVGPQRARTVLMAMLLAFIVSSLVFIVSEVARES